MNLKIRKVTASIIYRQFSPGDVLRALFAAVTGIPVRGRAEREFESLMDSYGPMVARICYAYANTRDDFEDLRQDAFVNIWRGLDKFRGEADLRTWVYRVTLNTCVSTLRRRRRGADLTSLDAACEVADDSSAEAAERVAMMHRMIARLGSDDKAMVLMWLDGYSYDEIAATMGMPRNTVATRLHRAKEQLINMKP